MTAIECGEMPGRHCGMWDMAEASAQAPTTETGIHPDDLAVDHFAAAMKMKMAASRASGQNLTHSSYLDGPESVESRCGAVTLG